MKGYKNSYVDHVYFTMLSSSFAFGISVTLTFMMILRKRDQLGAQSYGMSVPRQLPQQTPP